MLLGAVIDAIADGRKLKMFSSPWVTVRVLQCVSVRQKPLQRIALLIDAAQPRTQES